MNTENKVYVKDRHLYVIYTYFSPSAFGSRTDESIIPLDRIHFILEHVGPKGGFHGFEIIGFEKLDYKVTSGRYVSEYKVLEEYGKKSQHILEDIKKVLPNLKIQTVTEQGSAYV